MSGEQNPSSLTVEAARGRCPTGETVGTKNMRDGKVAIFSCEGARVRGDTAQAAANLVAKGLAGWVLESKSASARRGRRFFPPESSTDRKREE